INPIVDMGFGQNGGSAFAPAARFAGPLCGKLGGRVECFTELGPLRELLLFIEREHKIHAGGGFKIRRFDVRVGGGYVMAPRSDRCGTARSSMSSNTTSMPWSISRSGVST